MLLNQDDEHIQYRKLAVASSFTFCFYYLIAEFLLSKYSDYTPQMFGPIALMHELAARAATNSLTTIPQAENLLAKLFFQIKRCSKRL